MNTDCFMSEGGQGNRGLGGMQQTDIIREMASAAPVMGQRKVEAPQIGTGSLQPVRCHSEDLLGGSESVLLFCPTA